MIHTPAGEKRLLTLRFTRSFNVQRVARRRVAPLSVFPLKTDMSLILIRCQLEIASSLEQETWSLMQFQMAKLEGDSMSATENQC